MGRPKTTLEQRLEQKLAPQQLMIIRLLEVPLMQLEHFINAEVEANPALEEGRPDTSDTANNTLSSEEASATSDADTVTAEGVTRSEPAERLTEDILPPEIREEELTYYRRGVYSEDEEERPSEPVASRSFYDLVREQIRLLPLTPEEMEIAEILAGYLTEDGFLNQSLPSIRNDLFLFYQRDIPLETLEQILEKIQNHIEPAGLFARSVEEALLLQLRRLPISEERLLAEKILRRYSEDFFHRRWQRLQHHLQVPDDLFKRAIHLLQQLHPHPGKLLTGREGGATGESAPQYIVPDFVVEIHENEPVVSLTRAFVPRLRVSPRLLKLYQQLKEGGRLDEKTAQFIRRHVERARWLVEGILRREETLRRVMEAIVALQKDFFLTGDPAQLKPIRLKDIAEYTGLDISTVSRATQNKYVQTPYGLFPLRYFFSERIRGSGGKEVSAQAIRHEIQRLIAQEDPSQPLTDEQIARYLHEKGYRIARRTIAKYREQLGIPPARLRKRQLP